MAESAELIADVGVEVERLGSSGAQLCVLPDPPAAVVDWPPTVSVVVPATNDPATLDRCLDAIAASSDLPEEVVVVRDRELRLAEARNTGARRARGDIVVFLDADVLVHRDTIAQIRQSFVENRDLSAVFGSYDDTPLAPGTVSGFRNLFHHDIHQQAGGSANTFWTGLGAVARKDFLALGGFDGDTLCWPRRWSQAGDFMADVEFGMRLTREGRRVVLDPAIQGTHLKQWNLRSMVRTDFAARGVPWTRLLLRDRRAPAMMNLGWQHRLSALISVVCVLAVIAQQPALAGGLVLMLVALNHRFYRLMLRRRGAIQAAAAVGCHIIYLLTALLSVITGVMIYSSELLLTHRP